MNRLARRPSFSRSRRQPDRSSDSASGSVPPTPADTGADAGADTDTKVCKVLRGWLRKRHTSQRKLAPKWGKRFVHVDDTFGSLCYAHSETMTDSASRAVLHLRDVVSIETGAATGLPPSGFLIRFRPQSEEADEQQLVFAGEDREEARMWVNQLRARVRRWQVDGNKDTAAKAPKVPPPAAECAPDLLTEDEDEEQNSRASSPTDPPPETTYPPEPTLPQAPLPQASLPLPPPWSGDAATLGERSVGGMVPVMVREPLASTSIELARLRADFEAEHECELGCTRGELLVPLLWLSAPEGWSYAAKPHGGGHGLVPTEYLEMVLAYAHVPPPASSASTAQQTGPLGALVPQTAPPLEAEVEDDGAGVLEPGHRRKEEEARARAAAEPRSPAPAEEGERASRTGSARRSLGFAEPDADSAPGSRVTADRAAEGEAPSPSKRKKMSGVGAGESVGASPAKRKQPPSPAHEDPPSQPWDGATHGGRSDAAGDEHSGGPHPSHRARLSSETETSSRPSAKVLVRHVGGEWRAAETASEEGGVSGTSQELADTTRDDRDDQGRSWQHMDTTAGETEEATKAAAEAEEVASVVQPTIVAENNGVAIVADSGFVEDDWDADEDE